MGEALRFGALVLLGAASTLAVFRAPTSFLWQVAIVVTEGGVGVAVVALALGLPGARASKAGRPRVGLALLTTALSMSPWVRGVPVAASLDGRLQAAFGAGRGAAAPRRWVDVETLAYTSRGADPLHLDLYRPRGPIGPPAPLVVVVHGGSWRSGTRVEVPALNHRLARAGYAVASIDYRLAPAFPFPAAADDLDAAIAFLLSRAAAFGFDPDRIVLLGRSAGAQLALHAAYSGRHPAIRGVIAIYGPADMRYGYEHPAAPRVFDTRGVLAGYLGGTPTTAPDIYDAASPILRVGPTTPPTLLIHGVRDELARFAQSDRLAARLAAAGRPHLLLALPWATHGCDFLPTGPCRFLTDRAVPAFVAAVTR